MQPGRGNNDFWQEGARHTHDGWWGGPTHLILFLLLVALLVVAVVWLLRRLAPAAAQAATAVAMPALAVDPAVSTLRMRYARGEVSREDFKHGMKDLTGLDEPEPTVGSAGEGTTPTAS